MTHYVHVPLRRTDDVLQIPIQDLPDSRDMIKILTKEQASVDVWIHTAVGYYNIGEPEQFLTILETALGDRSLTLIEDRKKIYDTMAAYYMERAYQSTDKETRRNYTERAKDAMASSERLDHKDTSLMKGLFNLYTDNNYEEAKNHIKNALDSFTRHKIPALIARGIVQYKLKQYESALLSFREAVEQNPVCINELRIGFALCYYQLGREKLAQQWFERALDVDPDNVDAMLGLAVIEFNKPNLTERKRKGYEYIVRAYKVNHEHPRVLNYLAQYFFYRGDFAKAGTLVNLAHQCSKSPMIKAESQYIQGRIHQVRKEFGLAMGKFEAVLGVWPDHILARHGLAQMHVSQKDTTNAIKQLQPLLRTKKHNSTILKLLGSLEAKEGNKEAARKHLEDVVILNPQDWEAWLELAQLREMEKPGASLLAYEKAVQAQIKHIMETQNCTMEEAEKKVPHELWNNLGALRHKEKQYKSAELAYLKAIAASGHNIQELHVENLTTIYNIARMYEDTHRTRDARILYSKILKESPKLIECYIRLASIAAASRQINIATKWIQYAFELGYNNIDLWLFSGMLYFKEKDWQKSQVKFDQVLQQISDKDIYAMLALGNIYFYCASNDSGSEKAAKFLTHATSFYTRVLDIQPNCLSAICGIGCVLAISGCLDEARICFTQVRENAVHDTLKENAWINLAHINVKNGRYVSANQLYSKCLNQLAFNNSTELLLYIAHCNFCGETLLDSKRSLLKAIHINPSDSTLWYNLAITQVKYGGFVCKKKKKASLLETRTAISEVTQARKLFTRLIEKAQDPSFSRKYSATHCKEEKNYCESLLRTLNSLLIALEEMAEKDRKIALENNKISQVVAEKIRQEKEEKKRLLRERAEKLAEETREMEREDTERYMRMRAEQDRKRNRNDSDIIDDSHPPKKRKTGKKGPEEEIPEEDSDSDEPMPMPRIDSKESEEKRARLRKLNELQEAVENDTRSRKQKEIDEIRSINAGYEDEEEPEPEESGPRGQIRNAIKDIISALGPDEVGSYRSSTMRKALLESGISKSVIKANKKYAKTTAKEFLRQRLLEFR